MIIILKRRGYAIYPEYYFLVVDKREREKERGLNFRLTLLRVTRKRKNGIKVPWERTFHATFYIIRIFVYCVDQRTYCTCTRARRREGERRTGRISSNLRPRDSRVDPIRLFNKFSSTSSVNFVFDKYDTKHPLNWSSNRFLFLCHLYVCLVVAHRL